jgi:hypothetical protein
MVGRGEEDRTGERQENEKIGKLRGEIGTIAQSSVGKKKVNNNNGNKIILSPGKGAVLHYSAKYL